MLSLSSSTTDEKRFSCLGGGLNIHAGLNLEVAAGLPSFWLVLNSLK